MIVEFNMPKPVEPIGGKMKKISVQAVAFLLVFGITAVAKAEMTINPLVVDDAAVLPAKTFEMSGFFSHASFKITEPPMVVVSTEPPPKGPGGEDPPAPDPVEVDATITGWTGTFYYGLTDHVELGIAVPFASRTVDSTSTVIPEASGMLDIALKAKASSGIVSAAVAFILPTAVSGLGPTDNDMDIAFNLAWSPPAEHIRFHMNMGATMWGKDDATMDTSFEYGTALEFLGRGFNFTTELTGSTLKDLADNTPLDIYLGFRANLSKNFQLLGLFSIGASEGSNLGSGGTSYGLGLKWLGSL